MITPFRSGLVRNEAGSVLIMVAVAIVALFAFAILAIDGAILMTTKTQLQNAADAAALAAASGLLDGGGEALARERAIDFASFNVAVQESLSPVLITAEDVTFPEANYVTVRTHRTEATGDALRTYFRRVVDLTLPNRTDVTATATAMAFDVCASRCVKPWSIPDRWDDANGNQVLDPGESYDPDATGYNPPGDVGLQVVLKVGSPHQTTSPGIFYPVCYPPLHGEVSPETGAAVYREWIGGCEPYLVSAGDSLLLEPGAVVGPTRQGIEELIAQDPGAYWDSATQSVKGSAFGTSPRIGLVPFFDPTLPPSSGRNFVVVVKLGAFFIEGVTSGGDVTGRFMEVTTPGEPCPDEPGGSFLSGLALVN